MGYRHKGTGLDPCAAPSAFTVEVRDYQRDHPRPEHQLDLLNFMHAPDGPTGTTYAIRCTSFSQAGTTCFIRYRCYLDTTKVIAIINRLRPQWGCRRVLHGDFAVPDHRFAQARGVRFGNPAKTPADRILDKALQDGSTPVSERLAGADFARSLQHNNCLFCGVVGHRRTSCPKMRAQPDYVCTKCGRVGDHHREMCSVVASETMTPDRINRIREGVVQMSRQHAREEQEHNRAG